MASALPLYFMEVFLLPKEVLRDLDKMVKNLWWGFQDYQQCHFHPKAWTSICLPKDMGGLDLCRMEDVNIAMMAKLHWRSITNKDSLWVKVLTGKYCRHADFLSTPVVGGKSWIWSSLLQIRDVNKAGFCWLIRNGSHINIWCDPWVLSIENFIQP